MQRGRRNAQTDPARCRMRLLRQRALWKLQQAETERRAREAGTGEGGTGMICYACKGQGEARVHVVGVREGQGFSAWRWMSCMFCGGQGTISEAQAEREALGRRLREERKARGRTQADEAERLGVSVQELSRREWGRG